MGKRVKHAHDDYRQHRETTHPEDLDHLGAVGGVMFDVPSKYDYDREPYKYKPNDVRYENGHITLQQYGYNGNGQKYNNDNGYGMGKHGKGNQYDKLPNGNHYVKLPEKRSPPSEHTYEELADVTDSHPEVADNDQNEERSRAPQNIYQSRFLK